MSKTQRLINGLIEGQTEVRDYYGYLWVNLSFKMGVLTICDDQKESINISRTAFSRS